MGEHGFMPGQPWSRLAAVSVVTAVAGAVGRAGVSTAVSGAAAHPAPSLLPHLVASPARRLLARGHRHFGTKAATFTVTSATSVTATAPAGSGKVSVTVTTPLGTSAKTKAASYTY